MSLNYRRLSVRAYLYILVFAVFLPTVGVFTWHVFQELQAARNDASEKVRFLADEASGALGSIIRDNELVLNRLAARPLIRALDPKKCDPILPDYVSLHPEFATLALRDSHANIICTLLNNPPSAEQVRQTSWFQEGTRTGKFTLGDATLNLRVKRWVSISAAPVQGSQNGQAGFVFFSLDLLKLGQQIFRAVPKNAIVEVIDRQGNFLLRSVDPERWIGQGLDTADLDKVKSQQEGYFSSTGNDGRARQVAFVTVPGTQWRVLARLPEDEMFAAAWERSIHSIEIGIPALALVLAFAFWIGSSIVNPIRELARATERITRGESSARAPVAGPAEVAAVAQQFNHMLDVRERAEAEHVSLEEQLRESQKMEAIGTLAGGIAHDFNNIIATILGNVELARQDAGANPIAMESLEEIHKAGTRARNLVRQILSFSRRERSERKLISLTATVEESVRLLRTTLPARVAIEKYIEADVPAVLGNATQIEQVLLNLATNAMQAMHGEPGRIVIRLDAVELAPAMAEVNSALRALREQQPECTARLVVGDDGPGMDAATLERIFEPFFTTKPVGEGTGLGLSVVHGIVKAHQGVIVAESSPGKGSTFTIYFPVAGDQATAGEDASAPDAGAVTAGDGPKPDVGRKILYLDDDESMVYLVKRLLERQGFIVSAHTEQTDALAELRADPAAFDLVLTDYNMPGMSGLDIAREVRAMRADLPVAIASGFIDDTLRAEADGAGVRELIFKADAVEEFCAVVQRLLRTMGSPANDA